jgi:hypothetical protein
VTHYTREQLDRALDATTAMLRRRVRLTAGHHAPIEAYGAAWRRWGWLYTTWKRLVAMRAKTPRPVDPLRPSPRYRRDDLAARRLM